MSAPWHQGGKTLGTWSRRAGAAFALAAALAVFAVAPADARKPALSDRQFLGTGVDQFTWPPPGSTSYASAGAVRLSWNPGTSGATTWRLRQLLGQVNGNGACEGTVFARGAQLLAAGTSVEVTNQVAGFCYRYRIRAASADPAGPPAFVSGNLRVMTPWTGAFDLYRPGVFSTQATATWCVAASIQMMLNIVRAQHDHSRANQQLYIRYARLHDRYAPAVPNKGTDPQGWAVALNHFGGSSSYRSVASPTFKSAVRSAVRQLRRTGEPVGLVVAHSNHAWVMTGFEASADPATTAAFRVTRVYVMGPLYPVQQKSGYDMAPDTRLSRTRLRSFLTPYRDIRGPHNPWQNSYVTIQP